MSSRLGAVPRGRHPRRRDVRAWSTLDVHLPPVSGQSRDQAGRPAYPFRGSTCFFRSRSLSRRLALRLVGRRAVVPKKARGCSEELAQPGLQSASSGDRTRPKTADRDVLPCRLLSHFPQFATGCCFNSTRKTWARSSSRARTSSRAAGCLATRVAWNTAELALGDEKSACPS